MAKRERFYECVFGSEGSEYAFHLRARTEVEAEDLLRAILLEGGIEDRGVLLIRNSRGRVLRRSAHPPPRPAVALP
jgi:hypothetical protein